MRFHLLEPERHFADATCFFVYAGLVSVAGVPVQFTHNFSALFSETIRIMRNTISLTCCLVFTLTSVVLLLWNFGPQTRVNAAESPETRATTRQESSNGETYDHYGQELTLPKEVLGSTLMCAG